MIVSMTPDVSHQFHLFGRHQFTDIADTHHLPVTVIQRQDTTDQFFGLKGTVVAQIQSLRGFRLKTRIQQLLLGMIDDLSITVCDKAVAMLSDSHIVHIIRYFGETDINDYPQLLSVCSGNLL